MHSLLNDKRSAATIAEIELMKDNPSALWNKLDKVRGVGVKRPVDAHTPSEFNAFFKSKMNVIRAATAGAPSPSLVSTHGCVMNDFTEVISGYVSHLIKNAPVKARMLIHFRHGC